jgi:hypothetical protein
LQLGQEVPHVALDRLLRQEEAVADLTVHKAFRDKLEDLDLASGRKMLRLGPGRAGRELDQLGDRIAARRDRLEAPGVLAIPGQNFLTLSCVHASGIGAAQGLL